VQFSAHGFATASLIDLFAIHNVAPDA